MRHEGKPRARMRQGSEDVPVLRKGCVHRESCQRQCGLSVRAVFLCRRRRFGLRGWYRLRSHQRRSGPSRFVLQEIDRYTLYLSCLKVLWKSGNPSKDLKSMEFSVLAPVDNGVAAGGRTRRKTISASGSTGCFHDGCGYRNNAICFVEYGMWTDLWDCCSPPFRHVS